MNFLDCYNRPIQVGDVLANGQRQGSSGGIVVGVVTGFTANTIHVAILEVKNDYVVPAQHASLHSWQRPYERENEVPCGYYFRKSSFREPKNCFITGLSRDQLIVSIAAAHKIGPIEDPRITWRHKAQRTADEQQASTQNQEQAQSVQEVGLYD